MPRKQVVSICIFDIHLPTLRVTVVVSLHNHQKHLVPMRVTVVVSLQIIKLHLPTLRGTVVVSNFSPQIHFLPLRSNVVVVGYESWKHLPMMVSGTVRLTPLERLLSEYKALFRVMSRDTKGRNLFERNFYNLPKYFFLGTCKFQANILKTIQTCLYLYFLLILGLTILIYIFLMYFLKLPKTATHQ